VSEDEYMAAAQERINEAGLEAEELYEFIMAASREDAIAALREYLKSLAAWREAHAIKEELLRRKGPPA
jgi:hypothetical protein